jgi:hypothetical protein
MKVAYHCKHEACNTHDHEFSLDRLEMREEATVFALMVEVLEQGLDAPYGRDNAKNRYE